VTRADEGRGDSPLHPHVAYLAAAAGVELTLAASGLTRLHRFIILHRFFHFGVVGNVFVGIPGLVGRQRTRDVRKVGISGRGGNLEQVGNRLVGSLGIAQGAYGPKLRRGGRITD
jgi:hypothetical protein